MIIHSGATPYQLTWASWDYPLLVTPCFMKVTLYQILIAMCLPTELILDFLLLSDDTKGGGDDPTEILPVLCCVPEVPSQGSLMRMAGLRYMLSSSSSLDELCQ